MSSRFSKHLRLVVVAAVAAVSSGSILLLGAGKEAKAKRDPVEVKIDATAIERDEDGGVSFAPIVRRVTPSVVKVVVRERGRKVEGPVRTPFDDPMFRWFFGPNLPDRRERFQWRVPPRQGLGSGVIVSSDGYILTNYHVIEDADEVTVTLHDGREVVAEVIGADEKTDVAVIKVDETDLPAITFASSESIEVGDRVLAIGNPFDIGQTVTSGIISGTGRASRALGLDYQDFIQTDAAINPGNSGGALVDVRGRLIGINTAIFTRSGGFQGIGFAIPSDLALSVMNSLVQYGRVTRGHIGIYIQEMTKELAEEFGLDDTRAVIVTDVEPGSPADKAGLKSEDVIIGFNGEPVENMQRFRLAVASTPPGTEVTLRIVRDGEERDISVVLGERSGERKLAANERFDRRDDVLHGVHVRDIRPQDRTEFEIPARVQGAIIEYVEPGTPSALAGLAPGDVIMEIDGKPVKSAEDAVEMTQTSDDRKTLVRVWTRGGSHFIVVDETEMDEDKED